MRKTSWILVGLVLLLGFAMTVNAQGRPGRRAAAAAAAAPQPQLPAAVTGAVSSAFPGATVGEFEQDSDDGVAVYFVELSTGPEVEVTADGVIIEVAYDTTMNQVPAAAAQAIQKAGAGASIDEVQRIEVRADIEGGKAVKLAQPETNYLASFKKGSQIGEISVLADGTVADPLEWGTEN